MAVRTPVKLVNTYEIQDMTSGEIDILAERMCYLYAGNIPVNLSYVASAGSLNAMVDDRYQAGSFTSRIDRFSTEAETPNISLVTTTYDTVTETVSAGTGSYYQSGLVPPTFYPVYWDTGTGSLQSMSVQDMIDTFVNRATDFLTSGNTSGDLWKKQGTYFISTSTSVAGATLVNATPIFIDTTANAAAYTAGSIPEALDQPLTQTSYYLHRYDQVAFTNTLPITVQIWPQGATTNLIQHSVSQIDLMFESFIREAAIGEVGQRIRYQIEAPGSTGNICGSSIINTRLSGSSASGYSQRFVSADDYRTQEFPNGTATPAVTYNLRISKV
jgi:hypothetical protein